MFIAVRNDLILIAVEEGRLDVDSEIITVSVQFEKSKKLFVSSYYRSPSEDRDSLDLLNDAIGRLFNTPSCCSNLILGGDFNCGGIDWSSNDLHSDVASFACDVAILEVAERYGLNQHVNSPTRPASRRTLDLVFSTNRNFIQACHVVPSISDHDAILFEIDVSPKFTAKPPRKVLQHHKGDYDGIHSNMASFADSYLTSSENRTIDENWTLISDAIKSAVDRFIPSKTAKGKRHLLWISLVYKAIDEQT